MTKLITPQKQIGIALRTWYGDPQAIDVDAKRLVVSPYSIHWGEAHPLISLTEKSWGKWCIRPGFWKQKNI